MCRMVRSGRFLYDCTFGYLAPRAVRGIHLFVSLAKVFRYNAKTGGVNPNISCQEKQKTYCVNSRHAVNLKDMSCTAVVEVLDKRSGSIISSILNTTPSPFL